MYSALALGIETIIAHAKSKSYRKEIWLFTDGEYAADWGRNLDMMIDRYSELEVSLHVVSVPLHSLHVRWLTVIDSGLHFETDESDFLGFELGAESIKVLRLSLAHRVLLTDTTQFENIQRLRYFVDGLNRRDESYERDHGPRKRPNPSTFTTFAKAAIKIREPTIKITNPTAHKTFLSFNDTANHPGRSLEIDIEVKKVVSPAAIKSMKSMSTASYVGITGKSAGTRFEKDLESQSRLLGGGSQVSQHVPNNNLANTLTRETGYYAVKPTGEFVSKADQAKGKGKGRESGVGEKVDVQDRIEKQKDELDSVYFYGGTIVDTLRLGNGTGQLAGEVSGMQIVHFGKRNAVSHSLPFSLS